MVTGSSYLLRDDAGAALLIDMGVFQGLPEESAHNHEPLAFDPQSLSAVLLTHAHQDHCGRLPLLVKHGFHGKIFMTEATRELLEISLLDSAKIGKEDARHAKIEPPFDEDDVAHILQLAVPVQYDQTIDVGKYTVAMKDAGHILGSASLVIRDNSWDGGVKTIAFSGDLGKTPQDLIRPTQYIEEADIVIMESTYGDRTHPQEVTADTLADQIKITVAQRGTLLIPAFSIERTQMILHLLDHLKDAGKAPQELPVFLDSPMAEKVTEVYRQFPRLYSEELARHAQKSDPFDFPGLKVISDHNESKGIKDIEGAKVIIAGSGMMSGGRIMDHARHFLPYPSTRLLFVGYQAAGTIGRDLSEGAKMVRIYGDEVAVAATIVVAKGISAHADQPRLLNWLKQIQGVKTVFLTHGENEPRQILSGEIHGMNSNLQVVLPTLHSEHPLE